MRRGRGAKAAAALVLLAACGTRLDPDAVEADNQVAAVPPATVVGPSTTAPGTPLPASDVGVTSDEILVGHIVSKTSPLGADVFSGPFYGVQAYFDALNARGGINGRKVRLITCDDASSGAGNRKCVRKLVDDDKVFAFVGNSILNYAGAEYVNQQGVPDIGGQPINNAYDTYPHLFDIYGNDSPRNGKIGFDGVLTTSTEIYRWFKEHFGVTTAAVVAFNQSDSLRYSNLIASGLEAEGYRIIREQVDFAVPNFEAVAIDMQSRGVQIVFDAMDATGNVQLCKAMDAVGFTVLAKVGSVQSWTEGVRDDFAEAPVCRNNLYVTARTRNYMDTQYPIVAQFRQEYAAAFPDREGKLSIWTEEGWGAGLWFTDAALSCGANLTRACVEAFMMRPEGYDAHGLFDTRVFQINPPGTTGTPDCLDVARWQDSAYGGKGGWVSQIANGEFVCYTDTPNVSYRP